MKSVAKTIVSLFTVILLIFCLTSCIDSDKAKQTIEDFISAIEKEDYSLAESYLHPDRPTDLQKYLENIEASESINFQSGIDISGYLSVKSSYYDSSVYGSTYETTCEAKVGEQEFTITIEIVENDAGYGIYNFIIDF